MIIFRLSGGFGNQLWSFAAGYQLAKETNDIYAIDTSTQEAKWFFRDFDISHYDIKYDEKICYRLGDRKIDHLFWNHYYRRKALGLFTPTIEEWDKTVYNPENLKNNHKKAYYVGDWQHIQYFSKYEADIRKMYTYKEEFSDGAKEFKEMINNSRNSVAIHVRRGDYVRIGIALDEYYYIEAIKKIAGLLSDPVFYCFSEDLEWVKNAVRGLPYDFRYVDHTAQYKNLEDFELMRACSHQIISRSSYSWWAAYLNDNPNKIVIYPDERDEKDQDTWSNDWISIKCGNEK